MTARPPTPSSSWEPPSTRAPRRRSWPTAWPTPTTWSTAGVSDRVITVGGFQPGDITSEAQTGKEELVADGMRRAQVIALPFGENTEESMKAVAAIVKSEGLDSVTLVTDPAHSARARALASSSASTPTSRPPPRARGRPSPASTCCVSPPGSSRSGSTASRTAHQAAGRPRAREPPTTWASPRWRCAPRAPTVGACPCLVTPPPMSSAGLTSHPSARAARPTRATGPVSCTALPGDGWPPRPR